MANLALAFDILARDKASKTFDHVGKSSEGLGSKLKVFSKLGPVVATGLVGAATAAVGLGVAAAGMGIKTAAANEQAKISFTTMLGSGKKAQAFLNQLQQFAAATPFEFPELQTAASSLISAGINANKVIPIMRTLGDVTSGMGTGAEGVQRATIALQQMNAASKISGEDLNQLRDAGIPVYDLLSKATGKSKAEVVKLAQAGKLGKKELDQMMKALESGKGLERFAGLMDKQSHSLSGLWSTFKDTINMGLAKTIEPLIPMLKDGLGKASEFLAKALPKVAAALQWVVGAATGLFNLLVKGDFGHAFRKAFGVEEDSGVVAGLFRIRSAIKDQVIPAIKAFFGWLTGSLWPALVKGYQTIMPGIRQALDIVRSAFAGTGKGGGDFTKVLKGLGQMLVDYVIPILSTMIRYVLPAIASNIRNTVVAVKILWSAFKTLMNVVGNVARFMLDRFSDMTSMWAKVLRALSHVPGFEWAKTAADKMEGAAGKARDLSRAIDNIQRNVNIGVTFRTTNGRIKVGNQSVNVGMRASGGPVMAGGAYAVGDNPDGSWNPTTELFVPDKPGRIYNQRQLAMGSGKMDLSESSLQRLAALWAETHVKATITAGSVDAAMGGRLR